VLLGLVVVSLRYLLRGMRPLKPGWTWRLELWVFVVLWVQRRSASFGVEGVRRLVGGIPAPPMALGDARITPIERGGRPAWRIAPGHTTPRRVLHFHGGGYIVGSGAGCLEFLHALAGPLDAVVETVDYRLAPEHPYPAALEDAVAAYLELLDEGVNAEDIIIAGESAGGGLSLALSLKLKALGEPQPGALFLFSPWVQLDSDRPSYAAHADADILAHEGLAWARGCYLSGGAAADDPFVSPLFGALEGLPPVYLLAGEDEIFIDDIRALYDRLRAAQVPTAFELGERMPHAWLQLPVVIPGCFDGTREVGRRLAAFWRSGGEVPPAGPPASGGLSELADADPATA
jgi:acetyl esterase/lipase